MRADNFQTYQKGHCDESVDIDSVPGGFGWV